MEGTTLMKKQHQLSIPHQKFVKKVKLENFLINFLRIGILVAILGLWELFAFLNIIDPFIASSPSKIFKTII